MSAPTLELECMFKEVLLAGGVYVCTYVEICTAFILGTGDMCSVAMVNCLVNNRLLCINSDYLCSEY